MNLKIILKFLFYTFLSSYCEGTSSPNISGTSYFFKTNGNNEFKVYNRIHYLNHNITDARYNPHPPSNYKVVTSASVYKEPKLINVPSSKIFIDEEWNYKHKLHNKSDIPYFINRLYNDRRNGESNKTNIVKILFNTNANTSSNVVKFDLKSLKSEENITDADLYFYWPLKNASNIFKTSVVLKLYQVENHLSNELNGSIVGNPDLHKLFNIIYISKAQKGWQTFKIKKPIDNWRNNEENLGLLLTISSYEDGKLISIHNDSNVGKYRTFAVLNINKNETAVPTTASHHQLPINETALTFLKNIIHECSRKNWFVDFRKLQWDSFIIKPENGFNAFECSGKCHLESTKNINHVKMRVANGNFGHSQEKSCCVATEMLSLPIMYYDEAENIVIKNYDNMVVDKCGCR